MPFKPTEKCKHNTCFKKCKQRYRQEDLDIKSIYILLIFSLLTPTFPAQTETFETQNKEPIIIHPKKEVIHTEIKLPAVVLPQKILPIYLPNELPIRKIYVTEGQHVKKGEYLLSFDLSEIRQKQIAIQKQLQNLEKMEPSAFEKQPEHKNWFQKFFGQSKTDIQMIKDEWDKWNKQMITTQKIELSLQEQALQKMKEMEYIQAPFDGQITFNQPENISGYQKEKEALFYLIDFHHPSVTLYANSFQLKNIQNGNPLYITWDGEKPCSSGTIKEISYMPKNGTQLYEIRTKIETNCSPLHIGQVGSAKVISRSSRQTLTIPKSCVMFENNETFVYIIQNQQIQKKKIQTGQYQNGQIEVTSGIQETESILQGELDQVYHGQIIPSKKEDFH